MGQSEARRGTELRVAGLTKRYGSIVALDNLSLVVEPGKFQALLGPSGSGKTSLLMSVAGFLKADSGRIAIDGRDVANLPPEKRNLGMVFQGYALFPHLTVLDNVAFSLRARGVGKSARYAKARDAINLVRLQGLEARMPRELSGGQQQRVALARAIAFDPEVLLLDEPLSALDRALRSELQGELRDLQRRTGLTCLYVTHDQDEAMSMADVVAVLAHGRIMQIGTPAELYERPTSRFVASFLGKSNFLDVSVLGRDGEHVMCRRGDVSIAHKGAAFGTDAMLLALRPEKIRLSAARTESPGWNFLDATVADTSYMGGAIEVLADTASFGRLTVRAPASDLPLAAAGREICLSWPVDATVEVQPHSDSPRLA